MSKKYTKICFDEITRETEKAILVEGSWLPKSQLMVVINNADYNVNTGQVREYKDKTPYCLLLPLWLHMKNDMSYKSSYTLDKWLSDLNTDMRTTIEYEAFIIKSYKEYKEM